MTITPEKVEIAYQALCDLGLSLVATSHNWTNRQRKAKHGNVQSARCVHWQTLTFEFTGAVRLHRTASGGMMGYASDLVRSSKSARISANNFSSSSSISFVTAAWTIFRPADSLSVRIIFLFLLTRSLNSCLSQSFR